VSLTCLVSAHGSPGVTTTALVLASVWPTDEHPVVVEADPFGGVISARFGLADKPGLVSLAAAARAGGDVALVWDHAQRLPGGLPVLVAPPSADQTNAAVGDLASALVGWAVSDGLAVVADCGRLSVSLQLPPLLVDADRVLVLCRPAVDQLRPAADRIRSLLAAGVSTRLLLVGDTPYGADEVASSLDLPVVGTVAFDPTGAAALAGQVGRRSLGRSRLVRSVVTLASGLVVSDGESSSMLEVGA